MRVLYLPSSKSQQRQFQKTNVNIYPVRMAMEAEWHRRNGDEVWWSNNGKYPQKLINKLPYFPFGSTDYAYASDYPRKITEPENLPFLSLPHPDRVFTRAKEFTSGNYKYLPGTHMQVANGCWWGKCRFCVEAQEHIHLVDTQNSVAWFPRKTPYEVRPVEDVIGEIEECKALGFKEVFDDSGTFPTETEWLERFCVGIKNIHIPFSCNMRIANIDYRALHNAGFRMLLFGIESANQYTLDKINKGVKVEDIIPTIKKASESGLEPHIAVIFGWEWETNADALNTLRLVHYLLRRGFAKTAQASFICQQDIKGNESQRHFIRDIYEVWKYPDFWLNKLLDIKDTDDLKYFWRQIKEGLGQWKKH